VAALTEITAARIGLALHQITEATGAALVAAGLLSVLLFPLIAVTLLKSERPHLPVPVDEPAP